VPYRQEDVVDDRQTVVAAYDATDEADDGLALARLLADATDRELLVTRVLPDEVSALTADPAVQRAVRHRTGETRAAMIAALPHEALAARAPILPVLDVNVARALHEVARTNDAAMLVLGSSHHSRAGRLLVGGTADRVVNQAPCPVAIAPPGFRHLELVHPPIVGCAFDGTLASIDALLAAIELAKALELPLRAIAVAPRDAAQTMLDDAGAFVRHSGDGMVDFDCVAVEGDPATELIAATHGDVGMLFVGSRGLGPVRRALLGSVATRVLHDAACPLVVVPRRR
jgi:nucleotide-binding universal stress UspA family protein